MKPTRPAAPPVEKSAPLPGAKKLRPRKRRRGAARPEGGWGLISESVQRLGLWQELSVHAARMAFAKACHKLVPRLEPQARAESLEGEGRVLVVRVSSSAVASELLYVKDLLLEQVNAQLQLLTGPPPSPPSPSLTGAKPRPSRSRTTVRAPRIERLQYKVAPVKGLPDHAAWSAQPPKKPMLERPRIPWDLKVAAALNGVQDPVTRDAMAALYAAATQVTTTTKRKP